MTNFDFLKEEPKFKDFADVAISAEKIYPIDEAASVFKLPQSHGICCKMDVFCGRFSYYAMG